MVQETHVLYVFPAPRSKRTTVGVNIKLMTPQTRVENTVCLPVLDHMVQKYSSQFPKLVHALLLTGCGAISAHS